MEIGQKIVELRKEKGLQQQELAELLEITGKHLSQIENGHKKPRWDMFIKILKALDAKLIIENSKTIVVSDEINL